MIERGDSPSSRSPLRVGLLIDSFLQPRWVEKIVREITASDVVTIVLVVKNENKLSPRSFWQKLWDSRHELAFELYERLDRRIFRSANDPLALVDLEPLFRGTPVLPVLPRLTEHRTCLSDVDVETILGNELDVAVRFGFGILSGKILRSAKFGVWSYHHGDNLVNRGQPAGFWEVMEGHPTTGSCLSVLTETLDAGQVIYRSYASTHHFSVHRNRHQLYWKASEFLLRKLRELHSAGPAALYDPLPDAWRSYSHRLYKRPYNGEMAACALRLAGRFLSSRIVHAFKRHQWVLAYRLDANASAERAGVPEQTLYRLQLLLPPKDRLWADPFPIYHDERHYVFFEELPYKSGKGHISVLELHADGQVSTPVRVLERDYHLSYPFIFRWRGEWYMIPESAQNRTVEVYRALSFPDRWELDRVLLSDVKAVDATLIEEGGRWWMFVNIAAPGGSTWDELHLYYAESPLGPWAPHRRNPVKSDVRSARPAGHLFRANGKLYRPAQDCSKHYGYAMVVNGVERLDIDEYHEAEVSNIVPSWHRGLVATHTINAAHGLTVVDGCLSRWRYFGR